MWLYHCLRNASYSTKKVDHNVRLRPLGYQELDLIPDILRIINLEARRDERYFVRDYETGQGWLYWAASLVTTTSHQSVSVSMIISPDTPQGGEEALEKYPIFSNIFSSNFHLTFRVNLMISSLKEDGLEPRTLLANLEYVQEALTHLLVLKKE